MYSCGADNNVIKFETYKQKIFTMGCEMGAGAGAQNVISTAPGKNDTVPVVVVSQRVVPPGGMEEFKVKYLEAVDYLMKTVPGCKSVFCQVDPKDPNLVHDIQWFNDMDAFMQHVDFSNEQTKNTVMSWVMKYDMKIPFTGHVFGGWD